MDFDSVTETITPIRSTSLTISSTGALFIPAGTTAERPGSPQSGYIRFNTDNTTLEYYNGVAVQWQTFGNSNINAIANVAGTGLLTQTAAGVYAARTITGTTNRLAVTNGNGVSGNPTLDIDAAYVGQTSITTLGLVGVGTWNASIITANVGGTGQSSYAVGDILYASAATTLSKLADIATGNALISGGVATAPSWGKIGLTTHVTGTLAVGNGGTGVTTTPTNGQLLVGNGTNYTVATVGSGTGISTTVGAGTLQINNTGVTSLAGTANQITASAATGAITLSTPTTFIAPGSVQVTTNLYETFAATVSAAGATQGTATTISSVYNVVTTVAASTGVILTAPVSPFGNKVTVVNRGANALNVYPNSGAAIDGAATNAAIVVGVGQELTAFSISATQWHISESALYAGSNITLTATSGGISIASTGGGTPGGATTNVQYNNAGAFGGSSAFTFTTGANPLVAITGTAATNQLQVGGSTQAGSSTVYIETNTTNQDGQLVYFNSGSAATSGFISYAYDTATPYLRITDADDDAPYITFNTIGTGTYAAPLYVSAFGARGANGTRTLGANSGFAWFVGSGTTAAALYAGTPIMELDTQFLTLPSGTTANRPGTPAAGMQRFNSTTGSTESYDAGGNAWVQRTGIIDKTVVSQTTTAAAGGNIISYSVPGGTLGTTRLLRIRTAGTWAVSGGTARAVTISVAYGATTLWSDPSATVASGSTVGWNIDLILASNNSVNAQTLNGVIMIGGAGASATGITGDLSTDEITANAILTGTSAINSAANQTLNVSVAFAGSSNGNNTWIRYFYTIEVL